MKVAVFTRGFNADIGGHVALFKLAEMLRAAGVDVRIWQGDLRRENPYNIPVLDDTHWITGDCWVVYPEVVQGNPLNAKHVVRWLLNRVGVIAGDASTFGSDDLIFAYAPDFRGEFENAPLLSVFELWPEHIYPPPSGAVREGTCFTKRKGALKPPLPETLEAHEFHQVEPAMAGDLFRRFARFISYDTATFLSVQAVLCDCLSIVVPDAHRTAQDWRRAHPLLKYGIAYGLEDLPYALETRDLVRPYLCALEQESREQVLSLIDQMRRRL